MQIKNVSKNTLSRLWQRKLSTITLLLLISSISAGCEEIYSTVDGEPLEPEELGYYQEFERDWRFIVKNSRLLLESNSLVQLNNDVKQTEEAKNHQENLQKAFTNLKKISQEQLFRLTPVLPPSSMDNFHIEWLKMLQNISLAQSPQDLVSPSKDFLTLYAGFDKEFGDRPKQFSGNDAPVVEFQPNFAPVQANFNTQSREFSLEFVSDINTPIGEFSVGKPPEDSGITKLIVKHQDRVRYAVLAPGFEIYVPSKCGIKIKADKTQMIVEVPKCDSQSQTAPQVLSQTPPQTISEYFPKSSFPRASCGDSFPKDPSSYPLDFYPVFIDFSPNNLADVKSNFCQDAFPLIRKDTNKQAIQVASFKSLIKAKEFRDLMQDKLGSGEIGAPKTWDKPR